MKCTHDAWQWRPDFGPWFAQLASKARKWRPTIDVRPGVDLASALQEAAERAAPWLFHPCLSAITHDCPAGRRERDVALAGWLAAHASVNGSLTLAEPVWCWSTDGGVQLDSGRHELRRVGELMVADRATDVMMLDPWCTVLGYPYADTWAAAATSSNDNSSAGIQKGTVVALRTFTLIAATLPDAWAWLNMLTRILITLEGKGRLSRSSSSADLPGLVMADTTSELALSELLVHETAHHLLYVAEAGGPLIDPNESRLFASPLRSDARPMRGILLAYHALAFICAFYSDLHHSPVGKDVIDPTDFANLQRLLQEAESTLLTASASFTRKGRLFFDHTRQVAGCVVA
jgi:HEXXH motif-containing protein